LRFLEPTAYEHIATALRRSRPERERYIERVIERLGGELAAAGIEAELTGRSKHVYSIWSKMRHKRLGLDAIYDLSAVRILVQEIADCYAALGQVHGLWRQIPEAFDDYIARVRARRR
jgi:GTP pyrophosphokinase